MEILSFNLIRGALQPFRSCQFLIWCLRWLYGVICQLTFHGWWHAAMSSRRIATLHHVPIIYSSIAGRWRCELSGQQWQNGQLQAVNVTPASRSFSSQVKKRKLDNQMRIAKADGGCKGKRSVTDGSVHRFQTRTTCGWRSSVIRWIHGVVEWDMPPKKKPFSQGNDDIISFYPCISRKPSFRQTHVGEGLGWISCKLCAQ